MLTFENIGEQAAPLLQFIDGKWKDLTGSSQDGLRDVVADWRDLAATSADGHLDDTDHESPHILFLPHPFVYPGGRFVVQFYWDSYFIVVALLRSGRVALAKGMVDNLLYLVATHGLAIPNRKRWAAGSQLPFLSHMVREVHDSTGDDAWLRRAVPLLEKEYFGYWLNSEHLAFRGLSRYHALPCFPRENVAQITMDAESTWDLSPRFDTDDILDILPVDLNTNLLTYESNFAAFNRHFGDERSAHKWDARCAERRTAIHELMWDEPDGLFYDYNWKTTSRKRVKSLAAYSPLFGQCATRHQTDRLACNLTLFETDFGLVTCDHSYGFDDRQWNHPIGWAPLHWIVYRGLSSSGCGDDARRIALKWLNLNFAVWKRTGAMFEKYDVVAGDSKVLFDRYANQNGFGWTNAVFALMVDELRKGHPS